MFVNIVNYLLTGTTGSCEKPDESLDTDGPLSNLDLDLDLDNKIHRWTNCP